MIKIFFYSTIILTALTIGFIVAMFSTGGFEGFKYLDYALYSGLVLGVVSLVWLIYALVSKNFENIWLSIMCLVLIGLVYLAFRLH